MLLDCGIVWARCHFYSMNLEYLDLQDLAARYEYKFILIISIRAELLQFYVVDCNVHLFRMVSDY